MPPLRTVSTHWKRAGRSGWTALFQWAAYGPAFPKSDKSEEYPMFEVIFQFENGGEIRIEAHAGDNLLELARGANVAIDAP